MRIPWSFLRRRATESSHFDQEHRLNDGITHARRWLFNVNPDTDHQWKTLTVAIDRTRVKEPVRRLYGSRHIVRAAVAFAVVVAALVVGSVLLLRRQPALNYETGNAQETSIVLSDSSEVILNHNSSLVVNSHDENSNREVALTGEAFFRIRRDGTPFIVATSVGKVKVLGTEFNVRMRENQLVVAVMRGSVRVAGSSRRLDSAVVLHAGEITSCDKDESPRIPEPLPFAEYPGWMHGKFLFYRTNLLSACREIESQFAVTITIDNQRLLHETITGVIDGQNVESAISTLARVTGSSYQYADKVYSLR